jgi:hypothetical protein
MLYPAATSADMPKLCSTVIKVHPARRYSTPLLARATHAPHNLMHAAAARSAVAPAVMRQVLCC